MGDVFSDILTDDKKTPKNLLKLIIKKRMIGIDEAAAELNIEQSTVSTWSNGLVAKGLIERAQSGDRTFLRPSEKLMDNIYGKGAAQPATPAQQPQAPLQRAAAQPPQAAPRVVKKAARKKEGSDYRRLAKSLKMQLDEKDAILDGLKQEIMTDEKKIADLKREIEHIREEDSKKLTEKVTESEARYEREHRERMKLQQILDRIDRERREEQEELISAPEGSDDRVLDDALTEMIGGEQVAELESEEQALQGGTFAPPAPAAQEEPQAPPAPAAQEEPQAPPEPEKPYTPQAPPAQEEPQAPPEPAEPYTPQAAKEDAFARPGQDDLPDDDDGPDMGYEPAPVGDGPEPALIPPRQETAMAPPQREQEFEPALIPPRQETETAPLRQETETAPPAKDPQTARPQMAPPAQQAPPEQEAPIAPNAEQAPADSEGFKDPFAIPEEQEAEDVPDVPMPPIPPGGGMDDDDGFEDDDEGEDGGDGGLPPKVEEVVLGPGDKGPKALLMVLKGEKSIKYGDALKKLSCDKKELDSIASKLTRAGIIKVKKHMFGDNEISLVDGVDIDDQIGKIEAISVKEELRRLRGG